MSDVAIPPPLRVVLKGWWIDREMTYIEAERYHLREAVRLVGSALMTDLDRQSEHLRQAGLNRHAESKRRCVPMPIDGYRATTPGPAEPSSAATRHPLERGGVRPTTPKPEPARASGVVIPEASDRAPELGLIDASEVKDILDSPTSIRAALVKVAAQFRYQERFHAEKCDFAKAEVNAGMARICESALRALLEGIDE